MTTERIAITGLPPVTLSSESGQSATPVHCVVMWPFRVHAVVQASIHHHLDSRQGANADEYNYLTEASHAPWPQLYRCHPNGRRRFCRIGGRSCPVRSCMRFEAPTGWFLRLKRARFRIRPRMSRNQSTNRNRASCRLAPGCILCRQGSARLTARCQRLVDDRIRCRVETRQRTTRFVMRSCFGHITTAVTGHGHCGDQL